MTKEQIFEIVIKHSREILPELKDHPFQLDDRLESLGANSMDRAEITMLTMEALDIHVPRVEFHGANNLRALVDIFHAKL
jgi:polyketide biosynthesis acyl carrier protein